MVTVSEFGGTLGSLDLSPTNLYQFKVLADIDMCHNYCNAMVHGIVLYFKKHFCHAMYRKS